MGHWVPEYVVRPSYLHVDCQSDKLLVFAAASENIRVATIMRPHTNVVIPKYPMSMIKQSGVNIAKMAQSLVELSSICSVHVRGDAVQHDDVIKWKHFPRNWPFVRGIHRSR